MSVLTRQFFNPGYAPRRRRRSAWRVIGVESFKSTLPGKRQPTRGEKRLKAASIKRDHARRAVYVDFEGLMKSSPTLIGILIERKFEQVVLDPELATAASYAKCRSTTLKNEISRIVKLCRKERRLLVAYSDHEKNVIKLYCDRDVATIYHNARKIAARWNDQRPPAVRILGTGLKDYLDAIGYLRPDSVRQCSPAREIRLVQRAVARCGAYQETPRKAKVAWRRLLKYNEHDCRGMRQLVMRAATKPKT